MASRQPPESGGQGVSADGAFSLVFMLVSAHAACFWPFTRRHFGSQVFGVNGITATVLMWLYAGLAPCPAMPAFFAWWLFFLICHRYVTFARWRQGVVQHSRDDGDPWIARRLFWLKPGQGSVAQAIGEPLLLLAAGAVLSSQSESLGLFVGWGAASQLLKELIERRMDHAELRAMRDQEIEMRDMMSRYRERP